MFVITHLSLKIVTHLGCSDLALDGDFLSTCFVNTVMIQTPTLCIQIFIHCAILGIFLYATGFLAGSLISCRDILILPQSFRF